MHFECFFQKTLLVRFKHVVNFCSSSRNDLLHVRADDACQMGRLGGALLLMHQFRQHQDQRRHQANHEQLHVSQENSSSIVKALRFAALSKICLQNEGL